MTRASTNGWPVLACGALLLFVGAGTTRPAATPTYRLSDAAPLDELTGPRVGFDAWAELASPRPLVFGELATLDEDGEFTDDGPTVPVIATGRRDARRAVVLRGAPVGDAGWVYAAAGPNDKQVWGALDRLLGDAKPDLVLVRSDDGGETFAAAALHKIAPAAEFAAFAMDAAGRGRVTLRLADPAGGAKPGYYHYRTTDGGRTWANPEFEPDAMRPADAPQEDDDAAAAVRKVVLTRAVGCTRPHRHAR